MQKLFFSAISVGILLFGLGSTSYASEAEWSHDCQQGKAAFETSNYGGAERYFKAAIKEAEAFGPKDIRLANSLSNLAVLYNSRGQTVKATPLLERAIAIKQSALGAENPEVVTSVGRLCQFYIAHDDYNKAEPIAAKLAAFAQRTVKERQAVESSFSKLEGFYQLHREFKEAETFLKQAKEETHKVGSNNDLEFAVLLDGLGDSFKSSNKLPLSEQLLSSALAIREEALAPGHAAIAASCRHLGQLYALEGKYTQAEPLFKKAVQLNTKALGTKGETLLCMDDLAGCYMKEGKLHEAESLYRDQLIAATDNYGKNSKFTANALLALAGYLMKSGRPSEATKYYGDALNIIERTNGAESASLTPILESYAEALDKSNRKSEAKKYLARAKAIRG
jgi:tetratricopeptide (TPR) repeat protein